MVEISHLQSTGLFHNYTDKQLRKLGVPDDLLPQIRKIETESELDQLLPHLPLETAEALPSYLPVNRLRKCLK